MSELKKSRWGPHLWRLLHTMAATMEDAASLIAVMRGLAGALPCPECRHHFAEHLQRTPPRFTTPQEACDYLFTFHNDINRKLGKEPMTPQAYEAAYGVLPAAGARPPVKVARRAPPRAEDGIPPSSLVAASLATPRSLADGEPPRPRPSLRPPPPFAPPLRYEAAPSRWLLL
jgi:hypothetical protein